MAILSMPSWVPPIVVSQCSIASSIVKYLNPAQTLRTPSVSFVTTNVQLSDLVATVKCLSTQASQNTRALPDTQASPNTRALPNTRASPDT